MLQGILKRAAVAITLVIALLAPLGICLQPTHAKEHGCCAHPAQKSALPDCCKVTAPVPAVGLAQVSGHSVAEAEATLAPSSALDSPSHRVRITARSAPVFSPPGTSILRI